MTSFVKFPKIRQFRDVVKHVKSKTDFKGVDENGHAIYEHTEQYPTIRFDGTVKLHGTNSAIVFDENGKIHVQSRSRIINVQNDNAGFAAFVAGLPDDLFHPSTKNLAVFGEWCGNGIQKNVGINELDKMFVIFAIKDLIKDEFIDIKSAVKEGLSSNSKILNSLNEHRIFYINQFPSFSIDIDFNCPEVAQQKLAEYTDMVEKECPVSKYFGVSGIGEGIVWNNSEDQSSAFKFKVKGQKHSVSKVKTLAAVDIEKINSVKEFVDITVTQQRLEQGIEVLKERGLPITRKSTSEYLRWVFNDIISEEIDVLTGNGLCAKDVGAAISNAARPYWFKCADAL